MQSSQQLEHLDRSHLDAPGEEIPNPTGVYFDPAIIGRSFGRTISGINSFK